MERECEMLHLIANAITFLVALTIGVMLHFRDIRQAWWIVLVAVIIKLIIQPLLISWQAGLFYLSELWHQIVLLEAVMPMAAMTAVYAKKYGCDAELTSILVIETFISSCSTMVLMLILLHS
jgi:hypothetical protein